jgi:hypothetical protein
MRKKINIFTSLLSLLLCFLLFSGAAQCAQPEDGWDFESTSLEQMISDYMAEHKLDEDNFAMGWYDTVSGEEWFFNENKFMLAGSMYKLPLNMVYADKVADGELTLDDTVAGYKLETAMEYSLVYSVNEVSQNMRYALGLNLFDYRDLLAQYSGLDVNSFPQEYYTENRLSPRYLINTLRYLYENSDRYALIIDYMKRANPENYFCKTPGEYEIAHKYGSFEGGLDDCAIVYTPRPFLLTVFTKNVSGSEDVLSDICDMMTEYSLYLDAQAKAEETLLAQQQAEEEAAQAQAEREAEAAAQKALEEQAAAEAKAEAEAEAERLAAKEAAAQATAELEGAANRQRLIIAGVGIVLFFAAALAVYFCRRGKLRGIWAKLLLIAVVIAVILFFELPGGGN